MMADKVVPMPRPRGDRLALSEDSVAVGFARERGRDVRWCPDRRLWLRWADGPGRWEPDGTGAVFEEVRATCRAQAERTGNPDWGKLKTIAAVERLARTQPELVAPAATWDADPWLLGTPGGVVDLRDGSFRPARRGDMVTRRTRVDPAPPGTACPAWDAFLAEATGGDAALARHLMRLCGYALTGSVREQKLYFVYGPGGTGKGTLLNVVREVLGGYAAHVPMQTFMGDPSKRHPTELTLLRGARLVTASESERGQPWAEARIKELTGGDPVTARGMGENFSTFQPTHKLVIVGNHRPALRSVDGAAKRRLEMIPFKAVPTKVDPDLPDKLRAEYPAILARMIEGCLDWQAEPTPLPEVVRAETDEYFADQDALGQWLAECCEQDDDKVFLDATFRTLSSRLYGSWVAWAKKNGEDPGSNKELSEELTKRGFRKKRGRSGVEFYRLRLRPAGGLGDGSGV